MKSGGKCAVRIGVNLPVGGTENMKNASKILVALLRVNQAGAPVARQKGEFME